MADLLESKTAMQLRSTQHAKPFCVSRHSVRMGFRDRKNASKPKAVYVSKGDMHPATCGTPKISTNGMKSTAEDDRLGLTYYELTASHIARLAHAFRFFVLHFIESKGVLTHGPHACSSECTMWSMPGSDIYFCMESGNFHICNSTDCKRRIHTRCADVCEITGARYDSGFGFSFPSMPYIEYETPRSEGDKFLTILKTDKSRSLSEITKTLKDLVKDHETDAQGFVASLLLYNGSNRHQIPVMTLSQAQAVLDALSREDKLHAKQTAKPMLLSSSNKRRVTYTTQQIKPKVAPRPVLKALQQATGTHTDVIDAHVKEKRRETRIPSIFKLGKSKSTTERLHIFKSIVRRIVVKPEWVPIISPLLVEVMEHMLQLVASSTYMTDMCAKYRIQCHALIVVYRLQRGMSFNGSCLLPRHEWLQNVVYGRSSVSKHLKEKGVTTAAITKCEKIMMALLRYCENDSLDATRRAVDKCVKRCGIMWENGCPQKRADLQ